MSNARVEPGKSKRWTAAAALFAPLAAMCATLGLKVALHYSVWGGVPLYCFAILALSAVALSVSFSLGVRQAGSGFSPIHVLFWVAFEFGFGYLLVHLAMAAPISLGDGP